MTPDLLAILKSALVPGFPGVDGPLPAVGSRENVLSRPPRGGAPRRGVLPYPKANRPHSAIHPQAPAVHSLACARAAGADGNDRKDSPWPSALADRRTR